MAKSIHDLWNAHHVQFVWFVTSADGVNAADVFEKLIDAKPDQIQQNRIPTPANPLLGLASGKKEGQGFQIQVQPGRVDLIITSQNPDEPESGFGKLFDIRPTFDFLLNKIEKTNPIKQDVFRLSIIAALLRPVEQYADGASEFFSFLGYDPKIPSPTDLSFQINSRKYVDGVNMNRIINISTLGVQLVSMDLPLGQSPNVINIPSRVSSMIYAARRQFDFNTVPDGKLLEQECQAPIFKLIASEILQVASSNKITGLRS